jgi:hypothetical protein
MADVNNNLGANSIGTAAFTAASSATNSKKTIDPNAAASGKSGDAGQASLGAVGQILVSAAHDKQGNPINREGLAKLFDAVTVVDAVIGDIAPDLDEATQLKIYDEIDSLETPDLDSVDQILVGASEAPNTKGVDKLLQTLSEPIDIGVGLPELRVDLEDSNWNVSAQDQKFLADVLSKPESENEAA